MSKMIKCKTCNEEIAANAGVCPKCGAKQKKPFYKKWWIWVIAVIIIAAAISSGGNEDTGDVKKKGDSGSSSSEQVVYNIGDVMETKKYDITVTNVKTAKSVGGEFFSEEPSEGGIYVVVEWEYKNTSEKPISMFSFPTIRLSDKNGTMYDSDINATSTYATEAELDSKVLSDLNPGIKVKDAEVFEISEEVYNNGGFSVAVDADTDFEVKIN